MRPKVTPDVSERLPAFEGPMNRVQAAPISQARAIIEITLEMPGENQFATVTVPLTQAWQKAKRGDYFVLRDDGDARVTPTDAFEKAYQPAQPPPK
jgi:hypothetical protein